MRSAKHLFNTDTNGYRRPARDAVASARVEQCATQRADSERATANVEPLHVLTDRASGRTPRKVFATLFRYARGYRLCDPDSALFLGSGNVAGTGHGPVAWVGVRVSSLNGTEVFWYGATPLVA